MKLYAAITNSDLTEGKGYRVILAITQLETTAKRLGLKKSVMGSDAKVEEIKLLQHEGKWYVPFSMVPIVPPTKEDESEQMKLDNKRAAMQKAKEAGLTEEDIRFLQA